MKLQPIDWRLASLLEKELQRYFPEKFSGNLKRAILQNLYRETKTETATPATTLNRSFHQGGFPVNTLEL